MKKTLSLLMCAALAALSMTSCTGLTKSIISGDSFGKFFGNEQSANQLSGEEFDFTTLSEVHNLVRYDYIGEIDMDELQRRTVEGYLAGLGDRYASYMTKDEFEEYSKEQSGVKTGIGISVIYDNTLAGMYVTSVYENTPAMKSGLRAGDIIFAVDGVSIAERGYYPTIAYIGDGEEGEAVTLTAAKGPDHIEYADFTMNREVIDIHTVTYEMYDDKVAYVEISEFTDATPREFFAAMDDLKKQGAKAYVFDMRNNPGGALTSVTEILDSIIPEGPIIRTIPKNGKEDAIYSDAKEMTEPMAVITNGNTASAGELFSCALRDYKKAKLFGETTYGKGSMQTMRMLSDGSVVSFSTAMYYPPFSDSYEGVGIVPDVEVIWPEELGASYYLVPLSEDPQFLAAYESVK